MDPSRRQREQLAIVAELGCAMPPPANAAFRACVVRGLLQAIGWGEEPALEGVLRALDNGGLETAAKRWGQAREKLRKSGALAGLPRGKYSAGWSAVAPDAQALVVVGDFVRSLCHGLRVTYSYDRRFGVALSQVTQLLVERGVAAAEDVHLWLGSCAQTVLDEFWSRDDEDPAWRVAVREVLAGAARGPDPYGLSAWNDASDLLRRADLAALVDATLPGTVRGTQLWREVFAAMHQPAGAGYVLTQLGDAYRAAVGVRFSGAVVDPGRWQVAGPGGRALAQLYAVVGAANREYWPQALNAAAAVAADAAGEGFELPWGAPPRDPPPAYRAALARMVELLGPFKPNVLEAYAGNPPAPLVVTPRANPRRAKRQRRLR